VLEQLGEPFVTTRSAQAERREADEHVGMGLGFFIAKTLLERSGAALALANRPLPDGGAVVTVRWPRSKFEHAFQKPVPKREPVA
jgi:two-component system sensor histidine kinase RegB